MAGDLLTTPCHRESVQVRGSRTPQLRGTDVARLNGHLANQIVLLDQLEVIWMVSHDDGSEEELRYQPGTLRLCGMQWHIGTAGRREDPKCKWMRCCGDGYVNKAIRHPEPNLVATRCIEE